MQSGPMRDRVTLQVNTPTKDALGGLVDSWGIVDTRWSNVKPMTGKEYFSAERVQSEVTHEIRMRYYSGLTTAHRIKFGTRIFNILSILSPDEQGREHLLMCKEVT